MKLRKLLPAAVALTAVSAVSVQAQSTCGPDGTGNLAVNATACSQNHVVSTTVNDILQLTVSTGTTGLGNPTIANYGALAGNAYLSATPLAASAGPNVKVVANRAYQVSIAATTATFGPGTVNKPASDVEWTKTSGTFAALGTSGAEIIAGTTGTVNTNTDLSFRSRWAFERDLPGEYSLTLQLTLAAK
ncbi:hypothetical protein [Roseisolibacter agri]|uniref:Spore coat protein U domain-containing protein n=1 Tax=Roseisolibacter agri TaxID=2014610 RepID=A0AA37VFL5_9BACT|nr:hypothetical protein [Roseisolibacter agri]GLC27059.1 hypothetical protein rosag_35720 [Roseisolibacter agri]